MTMTYQETIEYLYQQLPVFHLSGKKAYKPGFANTDALLEHLGNPHRQFKSIHVAGTNGKGSSSHMLAAIFQQAGYKTGLYTSPHLKDYRERIKINGQPIQEQKVIDFVEHNRMFIQSVNPSFFELTVALAFHVFAEEQVDIAVIEVGMGGRLDSTNVILPELSLITNIGWDHADVLGDTLPKIAAEKAGIIKPQVPVVISERQVEIDEVFITKAASTTSPILFASDELQVVSEQLIKGKRQLSIQGRDGLIDLELDLTGTYQSKNVLGVLQAVEVLREQGYDLPEQVVKEALQNVIGLTGLKGRWQLIQEKPRVYGDTGHNEAGIKEVLKTVASYTYHQLWFILGFVADKDLSKILPLYPKEAKYVFCQSSTPRALAAEKLTELAQAYGLEGTWFVNVNEALDEVLSQANEDDLVVIGGSTFVVAEVDQL
ncbi:folylpolyglutamate synthase/dihydrofolate synthase family protein [Siphonobacter sp. SORGH_AS_1065]|uniref:bifunctional folylpolyglutamate synthase/dihydrofolate synthase n=1 Tax=Siphonobacter sp. SORGH_AS_1065 TaxID=3041795 RepID=UPI00278256DE|nr:folylpolyglutamate synthase/dihydrofolate synthase family protein [Siphonobacter sp. SORGH_AS_1065]MDQ1089071.1 dihydrofolate synthase/folylpolyglutamate synthase [Siphonobacter sp. SORGH_AS_1065]